MDQPDEGVAGIIFKTSLWRIDLIVEGGAKGDVLDKIGTIPEVT